MKSKRLVLLLVIALALFVGMAAVGYSAVEDKDCGTGGVTKIVGNKVTIREASDNLKTIEVKDLRGLKVGDFVVIEDYEVKQINPERENGLDLD